jgi:hypothetical protein
MQLHQVFLHQADHVEVRRPPNVALTETYVVLYCRYDTGAGITRAPLTKKQAVLLATELLNFAAALEDSDAT